MKWPISICLIETVPSLKFADKLNTILSDIRFWLGFFFLIRLVGITNAPLEITHSWRQSLTNMIARNFLENGPDLLHPMIDMAGEKSGIIGSEFPLFNFLIYGVAYIFDYAHWYGRLINLTVTTLGVFYFYKLIKDLLNDKLAFYSAIVLSVSVWFSYGRKIMPDTFSVALVLIGIYFAIQYLRSGRYLQLFYFFLFSTLGVLCKIPALCLLSPLVLIPFINFTNLKRRIFLLISSLVGFIIICTWYFYWVPHLVAVYDYPLFFPKGFIEGIQELQPLIPELLEQFYFSSLKSFVALTAMLGGCYLILRKGNRYLILSLSAIFIVFCAFIIKTGAVFPTHGYYIIPFTPIMALCVAYFLNNIPKRFATVLVILIVIEAVGNQNHDFFVKDIEKRKLSLEQKIDDYVPKNSLVIINGSDSPQHIYFANRKGWTLNAEEITTETIDSLIFKGAEYLIIDLVKDVEVDKKHDLLYNDEFYSFYQLNE